MPPDAGRDGRPAAQERLDQRPAARPSEREGSTRQVAASSAAGDLAGAGTRAQVVCDRQLADQLLDDRVGRTAADDRELRALDARRSAPPGCRPARRRSCSARARRRRATRGSAGSGSTGSSAKTPRSLKVANSATGSTPTARARGRSCTARSSRTASAPAHRPATRSRRRAGRAAAASASRRAASRCASRRAPRRSPARARGRRAREQAAAYGVSKRIASGRWLLHECADPKREQQVEEGPSSTGRRPTRWKTPSSRACPSAARRERAQLEPRAHRGELALDPFAAAAACSGCGRPTGAAASRPGRSGGVEAGSDTMSDPTEAVRRGESVPRRPTRICSSRPYTCSGA